MLKKKTRNVKLYEWRINEDWLIFAKPKFIEENNRNYIMHEFYLQNERYGYIEHLITLELSSIKTVYLNIDNFVEIYLMENINLYKNMLIKTNTLEERLDFTINDIEYMIKNTPWECTNCQKAIDIIKELL